MLKINIINKEQPIIKAVVNAVKIDIINSFSNVVLIIFEFLFSPKKPGECDRA